MALHVCRTSDQIAPLNERAPRPPPPPPRMPLGGWAAPVNERVPPPPPPPPPPPMPLGWARAGANSSFAACPTKYPSGDLFLQIKEGFKLRKVQKEEEARGLGEARSKHDVAAILAMQKEAGDEAEKARDGANENNVMADWAAAVASLQNEMTTLREQLKSKESEVIHVESKTEIEELKTVTTMTQQEVADLREEFAAFQDARETFEKEAVDQDPEIINVQLNNEIEELKTALEDLHVELIASQDARESLAKEAAEQAHTASKPAEMEAEMQDLKKKVMDAQLECSAAKEDAQLQKGINKALRSAQSQLVQDMCAQLLAEQREKEDWEQSWASCNDELVAARTNHDQYVATASAQYNEAYYAYSNTAAALQNHQAEIARLHNLAAEVHEQNRLANETEQRAKEELEKALAVAKAELTAVTVGRNTWAVDKSQYGSLLSKHNVTTVELQKSQDENARLAKSIQDENVHLRESLEAKLGMQNRLAYELLAKEELEKTVATLKDEIATMSESYKKWYASANAQYSELGNTLNATNEELQKSREENVRLCNSNKEVSARLQTELRAKEEMEKAGAAVNKLCKELSVQFGLEDRHGDPAAKDEKLRIEHSMNNVVEDAENARISALLDNYFMSEPVNGGKAEEKEQEKSDGDGESSFEEVHDDSSKR